MLCHQLLISMLAASAHAFAPTAGGFPTERFVLAPRAQQKMVVVTNTATEHQYLAITDRGGAQSPHAFPRFAARPDETIVWDLTGLCVEAKGDQNGGAVGVGQCTGERNQLWEFLPTNQIQLKDTNKCLNVAKEEVNPSGIPIKLRQCDGAVTEWAFESEVASRSFSSRHVMGSFLIITGVVALSLSAWLWRGRKRASDMAQGGAPLPFNQGGVCLTEPSALASSPASQNVLARCAPISMQFGKKSKSPSRIVLEPDYGFAAGSAALSAAGFAAGIPAAAVPFGLLGTLLAVRARVVRFVFDRDCLEVLEVDGDGNEKEEQRENFRVGGANRWTYKSVTEWAMYPSPDTPLFVYFRETQTRPEGQGHLFPMLCQPQRLREVMVDKIGEDKRVTTAPKLE